MSGNPILEVRMKSLIKKSKTVNQKPTFIPGLLTMQEVCQRYGISISLVHKITATREIPFYRIGRRNYFVSEEADAFFLERSRREPVK